MNNAERADEQKRLSALFYTYSTPKSRRKSDFSKSQKAQKGDWAGFEFSRRATQPLVDIQGMRLRLYILRFNGFLCFDSSLSLDKQKRL